MNKFISIYHWRNRHLKDSQLRIENLLNSLLICNYILTSLINCLLFIFYLGLYLNSDLILDTDISPRVLTLLDSFLITTECSSWNYVSSPNSLINLLIRLTYNLCFLGSLDSTYTNVGLISFSILRIVPNNDRTSLAPNSSIIPSI